MSSKMFNKLNSQSQVLSDLSSILHPIKHYTARLLNSTLNFVSKNVKGYLNFCQTGIGRAVHTLIGHFRVPKTPTFQNKANCTTFLVKMTFNCMSVKTISTSKAKHLTSFRYRSPGELGNGIFDELAFIQTFH